MQQGPYSEASKGGMKVGRMKDPLYTDSYLRIIPPPSSDLSRPTRQQEIRNVRFGIKISRASAQEFLGFWLQVEDSGSRV